MPLSEQTALPKILQLRNFEQTRDWPTSDVFKLAFATNKQRNKQMTPLSPNNKQTTETDHISFSPEQTDKTLAPLCFLLVCMKN